MNTFAMFGRKRVSAYLGKYLNTQTQISPKANVSCISLPLLCLFYTSAAAAESRVPAERIHHEDGGRERAQHDRAGRAAAEAAAAAADGVSHA